MECRDCTRWNAEDRKCLDEKVNPHNWEAAVSVCQMFGLRSICTFNDYRERLVHCRKPITPGEMPTDFSRIGSRKRRPY